MALWCPCNHPPRRPPPPPPPCHAACTAAHRAAPPTAPPRTTPTAPRRRPAHRAAHRAGPAATRPPRPARHAARHAAPPRPAPPRRPAARPARRAARSRAERGCAGPCPRAVAVPPHTCPCSRRTRAATLLDVRVLVRQFYVGGLRNDKSGFLLQARDPLAGVAAGAALQLDGAQYDLSAIRANRAGTPRG